MIRQFIWLEPGLIFALILANGFFAAAEIAIIATRKSRIDALLEKGVKSAAAVGRLKNDPDRFLATVQIGVTVVSSWPPPSAAPQQSATWNQRLKLFQSRLLLAGRNSSRFLLSLCRFLTCHWF